MTMDRMMLFDMIYALAARDGREAALFGESAPLAREAFGRSLAGDYFPELWFELPLAGEPWFDLHALASREDLDASAAFDAASCGGASEAFRWFAAQGPGARQLALSWDVGPGDVVSPAVQLLKRADDEQMTCDFLAAAGAPDAASAYRAFAGRLPQGWFACYAGVFPGRDIPFLRVECIPQPAQQRAYAADPALLEAHLCQAGLAATGDGALVERCQLLAGMPFQLEFQFDVTPEGVAGPTFAASVRFAQPPGADGLEAFDPEGAAGDLMRQVEAWGLADGRWRQLAGTAFAKRVEAAGESRLIYCYPAFLKLRWRGSEPLDAKAYLIAGVQRR